MARQPRGDPVGEDLLGLGLDGGDPGTPAVCVVCCNLCLLTRTNGVGYE